MSGAVADEHEPGAFERVEKGVYAQALASGSIVGAGSRRSRKNVQRDAD
jgi:hypothetical protein